MSWDRAILKEEASVITKGTTPTTLGHAFTDKGVPFLRAQNLVGGTVSVEADPLFISEDTHGALKRSVIKGDDVLISIAGTIGRASIVPKDAPEMNCNQAVAIVRPSERIDRRFMLHWMSSQDAISQMAKGKVTGVISNLSLGQIGSLKIPLPPLEEQRRIAGILDQADALRRLRTRALDKLNTLGQAIFHEMFGDLRENPHGWPQQRSLGEIAEVVSGITKGRKTKTNELREVPYLAVANVQDRHLKLDVVKTIEASETEIDRFRLQKDDILLTEGGDPDKLGRGTLWNDELAECIHQNHVFRVRVEAEDVRPTFLSWQIGSPAGKAYFLKLAKQTTGIASINKTQLKGFPVLQPPLPLQLEFEQRLAALSKSTKSGMSGYEGIEALFASLQHRAFRGEL